VSFAIDCAPFLLNKIPYVLQLAPLALCYIFLGDAEYSVDVFQDNVQIDALLNDLVAPAAFPVVFADRVLKLCHFLEYHAHLSFFSEYLKRLIEYRVHIALPRKYSALFFAVSMSSLAIGRL
jgi:hypothetical protein